MSRSSFLIPLVLTLACHAQPPAAPLEPERAPGVVQAPLAGELTGDADASLSTLSEVLGPAPTGQLASSLYPVGFSPQGAFAWYAEWADEAVGGYLWSFVVTDLVTDGELARVDWSGERLGELTDRAAVMGAEGARFLGLLGEHGVEISAPAALQPLPYRHRDASFEVVAEASDEDGVFDLVLVSSEGGRKRLGGVDTHAHLSRQDLAPPSAAGVIVSPHEPRLVVVVAFERPGYEGPPNVRSFSLLGAHLQARMQR